MKDCEVLKCLREDTQLPEGCTIGGDAYLRGYGFALPEGCTIGGRKVL